jgi:hypothetical protein
MGTDYRSLFDREYIAAFDLAGKDLTVTITRVEGRVLTSIRGKSLKPVIWFEGNVRPLVLNKTNSKTVATLYGNQTEEWIGKKITLYATTTTAGDQGVVDCIRVRPVMPSEKPASNGRKVAQEGTA